MPPPPPETALGGLYYHVTRPRGPDEKYVPMNVNFGLLPPVTGKMPRRGGKQARRGIYAARAREALGPWRDALGLKPIGADAVWEDDEAEAASPAA